MSAQTRILVGTNKGAFLFLSDDPRRGWEMRGPFLSGWECYSLLGDRSDGSRLYAGSSHFVYGPSIRISDDLGESWTEAEKSPAYTADDGCTLNRIWQIVPGHPSEPNTLYAGVDEAGLFVSRDRGRTWQHVSALRDHPTRPKWFPGFGGLCLHTILIHPRDPQRIWVGISAVGVFRTDDGGASWKLCNKGLPELEGLPETSEIGRCVHKIVLHPDDPDTLFMQYHGGVLISDNAAENWRPIEVGLPSNFGFPMVVTRTGDLFVIPLVSGEHRYVPDGRLTVYRSQNRGASWQSLRVGLPEDAAFVGVLRDSFTADSRSPAGLTFGTTSGTLYHSPDGGESWASLPGQLPRITTVKSWTVEA